MKTVSIKILAVLAGLLAANANAAETTNTTAGADQPLGLGFGLGFFDGDPGMMIRKDIVLGETGRHELAFLGGAYNQDKFTFRFDADYHLVLNPQGKVRLYPLIGADFAIRSKHNRVGGNVGVGLNFDLVEPFRPFVEAKYTFGDWEGFGLVFGVHF